MASSKVEITFDTESLRLLEALSGRLTEIERRLTEVEERPVIGSGSLWPRSYGQTLLSGSVLPERGYTVS